MGSELRSGGRSYQNSSSSSSSSSSFVAQSHSLARSSSNSPPLASCLNPPLFLFCSRVFVQPLVLLLHRARLLARKTTVDSPPVPSTKKIPMQTSPPPPRPPTPLGTTSVAVAAIDAAAADGSLPPVPSFAAAAMGAPAEPAAVGVAAPAPSPVEADAGTKDAWIPRDPRMLRLTGRHPFNSEAPLDDLMASGLITKTALHFVRNHGAVPRREWSSHRVTVDVGVGAELNASAAAGVVAAVNGNGNGGENGLSSSAAAAAAAAAPAPSSIKPPLVLTMDQIVALPARTLTVTMVCAGNRRKEQNMHKKSQGFNWGAAAVSTAMWTGVLLRDLLLLAGLDEADPLNATRHVRFCGPPGELPKGSDGRYGSSITLPYALNQANDVLVAYKQNGRWLAPDHGFPVRLILPGHIGGRTVKWLERIEVSDSESDNWYHFHDNRVLPPHVRTPEEAEAGGYWRNPDYVINHLNINSAISSPSHDAVVPLSLGGRAKIPFRGYAYSGGGRKITRVELSLDGGKSWPFPALIHRGEAPTKHGMHWAWVHWSVDIALGDLLAAKVVGDVNLEEGEIPTREIALRAADSSMNYQPSNLTWSLLGMMGNQHYRVKMHVFEDADKDGGELGIRFQHPAPIVVGPLGNVGWREEANARASSSSSATAADGGPNTPPASESGAATAVKASKSSSSGLRKITQRELARHASEESAWFSYRGRVFDGTKFLEAHPGGAESILISAGMDATEDFDAIHSAKAKSMLEDYLVGEMVEGDDDEEDEEEKEEGEEKKKTKKKVDETSTSNSTSTSSLVALDPRAKRAFPLVLKERLSENTRLFRFALPTPAHVLGLPVGKHVFLYGAAQQHGGNEIMRAYTPISSDADSGKFELVVKVYDDKLGGGMMSRWLDSLAIGDTVNVKGPVGHFVYEGNGVCSVHRKRVVARAMTFIAAGTGITPCYAVLRAAIDGVPGDEAEGRNDATRLRLIYANRHEEDVLLKSDLDALAARSKGRLEIVYTISRPNRREEEEGSGAATWSYRVGRIDEAMLRECAIAPASVVEGKEGGKEGKEGEEIGECLALMCGPHALLEDVCSPALEKIGFPKANVITF